MNHDHPSKQQTRKCNPGPRRYEMCFLWWCSREHQCHNFDTCQRADWTMNEDRFRFVVGQQVRKNVEEIKHPSLHCCAALLASTLIKTEPAKVWKSWSFPRRCNLWFPERHGSQIKGTMVRGDVRSIWNWFLDLKVERTTAKKRTVSDVNVDNRGMSDTVTAWNWKAVSVRRDWCLCYNTEEGVALPRHVIDVGYATSLSVVVILLTKRSFSK